MRDIFEEYCFSIENITSEDISYFRNHGVSNDILYGTGNVPFGVMNVVFDGDYWVPFDGGERSYIFPVSENREWFREDLIDLVSWVPRTGKIACRTGYSPFLGLYNVEKSNLDREEILVNETPLTWLQSNMNGCVILDWSVDLRLCFSDVKCVRTEKEKTLKVIQENFKQHTKMPVVLTNENTFDIFGY